MLLDGLQLVRFGGSVFEGVVLSARGISGEEADQVGAWRGGVRVRVSCAGGGPGLVGALSARGVSHRRLLRDAAIVLVRICLTQACAETTRVIYGLGPAWHTTNQSSTMGPFDQTVPIPAAADTSRPNISQLNLNEPYLLYRKIEM